MNAVIVPFNEFLIALKLVSVSLVFQKPSFDLTVRLRIVPSGKNVLDALFLQIFLKLRETFLL